MIEGISTSASLFSMGYRTKQDIRLLKERLIFCPYLALPYYPNPMFF